MPNEKPMTVIQFKRLEHPANKKDSYRFQIINIGKVRDLQKKPSNQLTELLKVKITED